jgi:adenosine/AMP kinase
VCVLMVWVRQVVDGLSPLGVEDEAKQQERRAFLRAIGHKK